MSEPREPHENAHAKKQAFLAVYPKVGTITAAAEAVGVDRRRHYDWIESDPQYCEAFEQAEQQAADRLENEAIRRAVEGVRRPVYQGKELVGYVQEYSDTLLIFLLKGLRPGKYRERVEHSGEINGKSNEVKVVIDGNWYGNANRFAPGVLAAPSDGAALTGPIQGSGVRQAMGQNGSGSNGNGNGPRPGAGGNGRSD